MKLCIGVLLLVLIGMATSWSLPPENVSNCSCKWVTAKRCRKNRDDRTRCWSICCDAGKFKGRNSKGRGGASKKIATSPVTTAASAYSPTTQGDYSHRRVDLLKQNAPHKTAPVAARIESPWLANETTGAPSIEPARWALTQTLFRKQDQLDLSQQLLVSAMVGLCLSIIAVISYACALLCFGCAMPCSSRSLLQYEGTTWS